MTEEVTKRTRKPKAATATPTHSLTIPFTEPEDLDLYDRLEALAKADRRPLSQYVLLGLHKAFPVSESDNAELFSQQNMEIFPSSSAE